MKKTPSKAHPWRAPSRRLPETAKKEKAKRLAEARERARQFQVT